MLRSISRILLLRITREEILQFKLIHFIAGLIGTWVVGVGRYWDDPEATTFQHAGLGSVVYIFLLAAFIWIIIKPFLVDDWNYFSVVTYIGLTSFPAIFYAIPVERFYAVGTSNLINVWFLAVVAAWRLLMLYHFLKVFTRLSAGNIITITLMPICLIITTLTILNLHRVVFNIMGGQRDPTPHDGAYAVLLFLTAISAILVVPLLIAYGVGIYQRVQEKKRMARQEADAGIIEE